MDGKSAIMGSVGDCSWKEELSVESEKEVFDGTAKKKCPYCGSEDVDDQGTGHAVATNPEFGSQPLKWRFKCSKCGKEFYGTINQE